MTVTETQDATYQIWVECKANLYRFIARRINNETDADDILQEVFVKVHSSIDRLRDSTKLHSWLYQITRNAIIDHYRSRKPAMRLDDSSDTFELAEEETPEADIEREEIMACLAPMMEQLPDEYRKALQMSDVEDIKQADIASELNMSVSGVKSRVQRARGKVKDMLLDCCHFEFDRLGRPVGMTERSCGSSCGPSNCTN